METIKVLHLVTSLNRGGVENWLISMLRTIPRDVFKMDVCYKGASPGDRSEEAQSLGAKLFHCPLTPEHFRYSSCLKDILQTESYNIVHNHLNVYSGFATWISSKLDIPIVTSFHNTHFAPMTWTRKPVIKQLRSLYSYLSVNYAISHSTVVTGCSQGVLTELGIFEKRKGKLTSVLYYGVDMIKPKEDIQKSAFRKEHGWDELDPVILHVGRFQEQKNHKFLIDVFNKVAQNNKNTRLVLVGEGPLRKNIENVVCRKGLESNVSFLGIRNDVPDLMGLCDVFFFPSLHEGLPVVLLEAGAAGLPIVASNIPGVREIVVNGESGFLPDRNDFLGMVESLNLILSNRDLAQRFSSTAKRLIESKFSTTKCAESLLEIYRSSLR